MNYGELIRRAFDLSWKNKSLWVLGFFAASMGTFGGFQNQMPEKAGRWFPDINHDFSGTVAHWFESNPGISIALVIFIVAVALALALFFFIMGLISVAGLIEGVNEIEGGRKYALGRLFKAGARYFWRFLGLFFIFFAIGLTFVIILILPVVLAFTLTGVLGVAALLLAIPIGLAGIFFFGNIYSLTQREIVPNETPVFKAMGEGYNLLIKHLGPNLIIFIINIFLWIAIMITGLLLVAIFALPLIFLTTLSTLVLVLVLIIAIPLFILAAIIIEGFLGTFFNSLMTLFYMELRKLTLLQKGPAGGLDAAISHS